MTKKQKYTKPHKLTAMVPATEMNKLVDIARHEHMNLSAALRKVIREHESK